jgi:lambda family phage portal protein
MNLFGFLKKQKQLTQPKPQVRYVGLRNYDAAKTSDLYFNFSPAGGSADALLQGSLTRIRERSRDLARNNDYVKKFKRMVGTNIIGANGILFQSKVKDDNGKQDKSANDKIETAWWEWGKKGNCDVTGKYSFRKLCETIVTNAAIDGEVFIRKIKGVGHFGFALQLLEADHLNEGFSDAKRNIKMGIEFDAYGKPIAYHLYKYHPSDVTTAAKNESVRVPADEIVHVFLPDRISQTRGIPWTHAAVMKLKMIGGYEEAELVAARLGACKGVFFTKPAGENYVGDDTAENGDPIDEITPGMAQALPDGWDVHEFDPKHPMSTFSDFTKAMLRGVASGLDVSYAYLTNDLESFNYSSIRAGVLDERETWMNLQGWFIEEFMNDIYKEWLEMALLTQALALPFSKFGKFHAPFWMPRRWAWVDPQKDITANILAIKSGLKAPSMVAAEMGYDLEEVYEAIKRDDEMRKSLGITTIDDATLLQLLGSLAQNKEGANNE